MTTQKGFMRTFDTAGELFNPSEAAFIHMAMTLGVEKDKQYVRLRKHSDHTLKMNSPAVSLLLKPLCFPTFLNYITFEF